MPETRHASRPAPDAPAADAFDPMASPAVRQAGERFVSGRIGRERFDAVVEAERRRFVKRRVREVAANSRA